MHPEWLAYFKDVIEGRPAPPWHLWWRDHQALLEPVLGRRAYLQLKLQKLEYAAALLSAHGVDFEWSDSGRLAVAHGRLHPSCLDDDGRPRPEYRERDGGYLEAFCRGDVDGGHRLVEQRLAALRLVEDDVRRAEELGDFEFDAQALLDEGHVEAAVAALAAVARWEPLSGLENAAVRHARERLRARNAASP